MTDAVAIARQRMTATGGASRPWIAARVVFYVLFALVDAAAMSKDIFSLGIWLLVIPALILVVIQWAFLVAPLIDWPLTAWRRTGKLSWTALWLGLALMIPVGIPAIANAWQTASIAMDRSGDVMPSWPLSIPGPILLTGDCDQDCEPLLRTGVVDRVLKNPAVWGDDHKQHDWQDGEITSAKLQFASTYCDKSRGEEVFELRSNPGWCLVSQTVKAPAYRAVVVFEGFSHFKDNQGRRRIEVWSCKGPCTLIARQTERRGGKFALPLQIAYRGVDMGMDPQFKRIPFTQGDAEPKRVFKEALSLNMPGTGPRLGEDPEAARLVTETRLSFEAAKQVQAELERRQFLLHDQQEREADLARRRRDSEIIRRNSEKGCPVTDRGDGTFSNICPRL